VKRRLAIAAMALVLVTGGCSAHNDARGRGDAPIGEYDDTPAEVINFPDQFANVAHKCDGHGHRVYSTTREAPPVVISDPSCPGGGAG
jgi:hypothetical protein